MKLTCSKTSFSLFCIFFFFNINIYIHAIFCGDNIIAEYKPFYFSYPYAINIDYNESYGPTHTITNEKKSNTPNSLVSVYYFDRNRLDIIIQQCSDFSPLTSFAGFCLVSDVVEQYEEKMKKLAGKLMWLMLASLGISMEDVEWAGPKGHFDGASAALQLNSYPTCPDPDRAMGLAAHTDSTLLTILYQNRISGLQVFREGSGWVTVPPLSGGFVINVGDLFHILSNGLYPSVLHRVLVNRIQPRLSVAYLYGPPSSVKISPHPKLVGPSSPPLYRPVTWNEYLGTKAKHFNKALSSVRLCAPKNGLFDVNESHNNSVQVG